MKRFQNYLNNVRQNIRFTTSPLQWHRHSEQSWRLTATEVPCTRNSTPTLAHAPNQQQAGPSVHQRKQAKLCGKVTPPDDLIFLRPFSRITDTNGDRWVVPKTPRGRRHGTGSIRPQSPCCLASGLPSSWPLRMEPGTDESRSVQYPLYVWSGLQHIRQDNRLSWLCQTNASTSLVIK
jgi:hypothetical protein